MSSHFMTEDGLLFFCSLTSVFRSLFLRAGSADDEPELSSGLASLALSDERRPRSNSRSQETTALEVRCVRRGAGGRQRMMSRRPENDGYSTAGFRGWSSNASFSCSCVLVSVIHVWETNKLVLIRPSCAMNSRRPPPPPPPPPAVVTQTCLPCLLYIHDVSRWLRSFRYALARKGVRDGVCSFHSFGCLMLKRLARSLIQARSGSC